MFHCSQEIFILFRTSPWLKCAAEMFPFHTSKNKMKTFLQMILQKLDSMWQV